MLTTTGNYNRHAAAIETVKHIVCAYYGIEVERMESRGHNEETLSRRSVNSVAEVKQIISYFCYRFMIGTVGQVAASMGYADHTQPSKAWRKISDLLTVDKALQQQVPEIEALMMADETMAYEHMKIRMIKSFEQPKADLQQTLRGLFNEYVRTVEGMPLHKAKPAKEIRNKYKNNILCQAQRTITVFTHITSHAV